MTKGVLKRPLTKTEMKKACKGTVAIDLSDIIDTVSGDGLEGFLDLLSMALTGTPLLMDIEYRVVGHLGDSLHFEVEGDPSAVLED